MNTPIYDFVTAYADRHPARLHMPGHKGRGCLGVEQFDITEIPGADDLYHPGGIIAESETNAALLFGAACTVYSTEGSSQCIRAMVHLAADHITDGKPLFLAARNAHKTFLYAAALVDADIQWLWPDEQDALCSCSITPKQLERALTNAKRTPAAVYVTSPDYLGNLLPIAELAEVCHRHNTLLLVDNAHGAYLRFLPEDLHPITLGADLCCDSAHKTLPVLTGGAYLHMSQACADLFAPCIKEVMALYGSTSPSYLTLASLDLCNRYLDSQIRTDLTKLLPAVEQTRTTLAANGWQLVGDEPLKLTLRCPGTQIANLLAEQNVFCEYADSEHLVLMLSPSTDPVDLELLVAALGKNHWAVPASVQLPPLHPAQALSPRQAIFAPQEQVPIEQAVGRICAAPTVSCPPAIPIAVSGEVVDEAALVWLTHYGMDTVCVVK
ncbi:MAG: aminotransferase class V-fold PLP-dependent enzyme [Oscillospiraceae bacterium]|nr:aminotransferase class V-fold PLP-dependent enzyme [Oscillospiraceae bacterium]